MWEKREREVEEEGGRKEGGRRRGESGGGGERGYDVLFVLFGLFFWKIQK